MQRVHLMLKKTLLSRLSSSSEKKCCLRPQAAGSHSISPSFQFYLASLFFFNPVYISSWPIPQKLLLVAANSLYKHDGDEEKAASSHTHRLSHCGPHRPHFMAAASTKWSIYTVFHTAECVCFLRLVLSKPWVIVLNWWCWSGGVPQECQGHRLVKLRSLCQRCTWICPACHPPGSLLVTRKRLVFDWTEGGGKQRTATSLHDTSRFIDV